MACIVGNVVPCARAASPARMWPEREPGLWNSPRLHIKASRPPLQAEPARNEKFSASRPVSRVLYGGAGFPPFRAMTIPLGRLSPAASCDQPGRRPGDGMRAFAFCRPYSVLLPAGLAMPPALPRERCALTAPFHPYRDERGGLLSVALSLGSPPPDVIRRRVSVEPGLSSAVKQRSSGRLAARGVGARGGKVKRRVVPARRSFPSKRVVAGGQAHCHAPAKH